MTITPELIELVAGTITVVITAERLIIPQIIKLLTSISEKRKNKNKEEIDVKTELNQIEKENSNLYENQITFFIGQIDILQKQLLKKTDEITEMNIQCDELRNQLLIMQKQIFELKQQNNKLIQNTCNNIDCPKRNNKLND